VDIVKAVEVINEAKETSSTRQGLKSIQKRVSVLPSARDSWHVELRFALGRRALQLQSE